MNATGHTQQPRLLTPVELAMCIKLFREMRQWSQEQLSEISRLSVRTIQRVEQGLSASLDTRRALASAFEFEDIDAFNKPYSIPTEEEFKAAREKFDRDHVTLTAIPLTTGKQLLKLAETSSADLSEPAFDMPREAAETFALLVDYLRDYRDCADHYSETDKLDLFDEIQGYIDQLKVLGVSLRYAVRKVLLKLGNAPDIEPTPAEVLYMVAFPVGEEPEQFATPKSGPIRL